MTPDLKLENITPKLKRYIANYISIYMYILLLLVAPTVTEFGPMNINVDEHDRVEFVCKAVGPPTPTIKVVKARPTPGKKYIHI